MPPLPHSNIQRVNQAQLRYPNPFMKCNYWLQRRNRVSRLLSCLREKGFGELISDFGHTRSSPPRVSSLGQRPFAVQHYRQIPKAYETKLILAEKKDFTVNAYGGLSDFEKVHASTTGLFKDTQSVHDPTDNESPDRSGLPLGHEGSSLGLNEITIVEARYPSGSCQLLCAKLVHKLMSNRIMSV